MVNILYLFLDTNVLVQCRPLKELDWSPWREADEVHLIVSRPVQSEIDDQKNKGGDRLARRARKASSLLRNIHLSGSDHLVISSACPAVKLFIKVALRPDQALTDVLDYSHKDDQLVGIICAFKKENPGSDARVLTHDGGPMASANMVGVAIAPVPDEWLLPPEQSEADKKVRALEAELALLKSSQPEFAIACVSAKGDKLDMIELEVPRYHPLTQEELSALLEKIARRFPPETNFGPTDREERPTRGLNRFMGLKEVFTPVTEVKIAEYRQKHREWLDECEGKLRNLHGILQSADGPPKFCFNAANNGTRPAEDALVTFRAKGQFSIMPPPYRAPSEEEDLEQQAALSLPSPPTAPRGSWTMQAEIFNALSRLGLNSGLLVRGHAVPGERHILPTGKRDRDPNEFYYKPDRLSSPDEEFSLECKQWRHGLHPETFVGQIHFDDELEEISGTLECSIHAANLPQIVAKVIPIFIRVHRKRVLDIANNLISNL
jgi:hypothetical protein